MRQEAAQLAADGCGAAEQLRDRQEENNQKLLLATRNLHAVNLRAYAFSLANFAQDKLPRAIELWQGQSARDAQEAEAQAKSLEQFVFVAVPESDGPVFSLQLPQFEDLPVVAYMDLRHDVPEITAVLPKVRDSGGVVIAFVAGSVAEVAARLALEQGLVRQLPEDGRRCRAFIREAPKAGCSAQYVGWVLIALWTPIDGSLSRLQERVLASPAFLEGCLLDFPAYSADDRLRTNTGHDLCPDQRSTSFHAAMLQGCGISTPFMASGHTPMDFVLVQDETCTSSLARCVANMALAADKISGSLSPRVHLVTQARKWSEESRPSLNFRSQHLAAARTLLAPRFSQRALKRRKTDTAAQLELLAAELPKAPLLPPKLGENLQNAGTSASAIRPFLVPLGREIYDAARAKLPQASVPERIEKYHWDSNREIIRFGSLGMSGSSRG